jgi:hypothetical protein
LIFFEKNKGKKTRSGLPFSPLRAPKKQQFSSRIYFSNIPDGIPKMTWKHLLIAEFLMINCSEV